jgi:hypothetical protein
LSWIKLKPWLPLVGAVPVLWLGLYIMFWIDRADCADPVAACLGNAFGNWLGDVVMLRWVKGYQGLLAGLLTLVAGAFVWLTYRAQRTDFLSDRANAKRRLGLAALANARHHLSMADLAIWRGADRKEEIAAALAAVYASLPAVRDFAPSFAYWLQQITKLAGILVDGGADAAENARQFLTAAVLYMDEADRLFDSHGDFVLTPADRALLRDLDIGENILIKTMFE